MASKLCSDCALLILNDEAIFKSGVVESVNDETSSPALHYKRLPLFSQASRTEVFRDGASNKTIKHAFHHCIPLQATREDIYPTFSELAKSASDGCTFCRVLRKTIINKINQRVCRPKLEEGESPGSFDDYGYWDDFSTDEKVQISFGYFLRYYNYTQNLRSNSISYSADNDVCGLARISAKVSKIGEDSLAVKEKYANENDPYEFSETHVNFSVEVDNFDTSVGRYLQIYGLPIDENPLSTRNVELMMNWIAACIRCHADDCGIEDSIRNSTRETAPTRLLFVGSEDEDPRLIIPKNTTQEFFHYAALSYCWGTPQPLKTESHTLSERLHAIPFQTLPAVFQDAVKVARALKIGYIWIDSLCILQGDEEDWRKESARMVEVFRNAVITFAAVSSSSSHESFLLPRGLRTDQRVKFPFESTRYPEISGTYLISPEKNEKNTLDDLDHSSWGNRGWTFQEQHLSKRMIVFGNTMLHFYCREWSLYENSVALSKRTLVDAPSFSRHNNSCCQEHAHANIYKIWYELSEQYSSRQLTYFTDRLPSIQGLAKEMHETLQTHGIQDTYLGGIWMNDLLYGLLWKPQVHNSRQSPMNAACYISPTWCWTSYFGKVSFDAMVWPGSSICEILDASVHLIVDEDPFGAVSGGSLNLRAHLYRSFSFADSEVLKLCGAVRSSVEEDKIDSGIFLDAITGAENVVEVEKQSFWIVPIWFEGWREDIWQYLGLVLQLSNDGGEVHEFVRIGMFKGPELSCKDPHQFLAGFEWVEKTVVIV